MVIILQEIRSAVQNYLDTQVTVTLSSPAPAPGAGQVINPNEEFTFKVTGSNNGSVRLKNVRYYLKVNNSAIAKLIVPGGLHVARSGPLASSSQIAAGTQVNEMYLFPNWATYPPSTDFPNVLTPGDIDTITGLKGKTLVAGSTSISAKILADIDPEFLFPPNEDSPSGTKPLVVVST